jgi:hypothetical protein
MPQVQGTGDVRGRYDNAKGLPPFLRLRVKEVLFQPEFVPLLFNPMRVICLGNQLFVPHFSSLDKKLLRKSNKTTLATNGVRDFT